MLEMVQKINSQEGARLYLQGEVMSWKTFLSLPSCPQKLVKINRHDVLFNWAPFGPDVSPFLMTLIESQSL